MYSVSGISTWSRSTMPAEVIVTFKIICPDMSAVDTSVSGTPSPSILPLTATKPFDISKLVLTSYIVVVVFTTSIIKSKSESTSKEPKFNSNELFTKPGMKLSIVVPCSDEPASLKRMSFMYKLLSDIVKSTLPLKLMCCVSPTASRQQ